MNFKIFDLGVFIGKNHANHNKGVSGDFFVNPKIHTTYVKVRKIMKFIYRVNFWIHRKIPGITLIVIFPKIVVFEQKYVRLKI